VLNECERWERGKELGLWVDREQRGKGGVVEGCADLLVSAFA